MENQPKRLYLHSDNFGHYPPDAPTPQSQASHPLHYSSSNYNRSFDAKPQGYLVHAIAAKQQEFNVKRQKLLEQLRDLED